MNADKRKHKRTESFKLISYTCLDEQLRKVTQGMGRTLNVSLGGILLETHVNLEIDNYILLSIGLCDKMIDIKGKVVRCTEDLNGMFMSGIKFQPLPSSKEIKILNKYIKVFHEYKKDR